MILNWEPGERIRRLPRVLRPFALLWRNIWFFRHNYRLHRQRVRYESSPSIVDVLEHLDISVDYVFGADVNGDVAEFGTAYGTSAGALARAMSRYAERKLLLFDSFEGLPEATSEIDRQTPMIADGIWAAGENKVLSESQLRRLCQRFLASDRIATYKGWYADTLPNLPDSAQFALMHIDCDFYQSTMDVLDPSFHRGFVQEGCIILFDDWNCNAASPRFGERRAWAEIAEKYSVEYSDGGQYGWACQKFIVHSYKRS